MFELGYILFGLLILFFLYGVIRVLGYAWWKSKFEAWISVVERKRRRKDKD